MKKRGCVRLCHSIPCSPEHRAGKKKQLTHSRCPKKEVLAAAKEEGWGWGGLGGGSFAGRYINLGPRPISALPPLRRRGRSRRVRCPERRERGEERRKRWSLCTAQLCFPTDSIERDAGLKKEIWRIQMLDNLSRNIVDSMSLSMPYMVFSFGFRGGGRMRTEGCFPILAPA